MLLDAWTGERGLALLAETGTTMFIAAPTFINDLVAAAGGEPQQLPALRVLAGTGTATPKRLITEVPRLFGVPLRASWG